MLQAGAAEVVITPPVGTPLDGYFSRAGGATSVHDDLHARALVIDDGQTRAALVSCDLLAVDRRLVAAVRDRASAATGIPAGHILVAATHTHAGPAGLRWNRDEGLVEMTARTIAGAIAAASERVRPAVLKAGRGSVDSVSQNRRRPDGPYEGAMHVLLFDSPDLRDGVIASVVNFACHATVLFQTNMAISADYPGYAVRTVKRVVGEAPVLFFNGACGDVNPAWMEQRHDEAERVGSIVGAEAARRIQELRPLGARQRAWNIRWDELTEKPVTSGELVVEPRIRVAGRNVDVPLREFLPPDEYDRRLAGLEAERAGIDAADIEARRRVMEQITRYDTERGVAASLGRTGGHLLHPETQAIALGDGVAILGLPGEFFVETARAIREAAGVRHLLVACYANHYVGYFVPRAAFAEGGYEPGVAMLDETAEERMRGAAIEVLRSLQR